MATSDYVNRIFDVLAFRGAMEDGEQLLRQTLFDVPVGQTIFAAAHGGEICTGVQKLAQRWVLEFLTVRGSMGFHLADRGSEFVQWARSGRLRTEFDVQAYFNFAAQQVRTSLINEETDDMNDEERLRLVNLTQVVLFAGVLELYITLISQAGTSREVILPISIVPVNMAI